MSASAGQAAAPIGVAGATNEASHRAAQRRDRLHAGAWRIAGYALVMTAWVWASGRVLPEYLLPTPWAIAEVVWQNLTNGAIFYHFGQTLQKIGIGFAITFPVGATIGALMRRPFWDGFFRDAVIGAMSTPGLVFALTAAIIFGLSPYGPVFAIVLTSIPFVTVNIAEGAKAIPRDLLAMASAYGVSERQRIRHVLVPHLGPYTFTAVRYGFAISWKVAMLTELFGSASGIGFRMRLAYLNFSMTEMLSWAAAFFLFALFIEKVVMARLESRFFRWRQEVTPL